MRIPSPTPAALLLSTIAWTLCSGLWLEPARSQPAAPLVLETCTLVQAGSPGAVAECGRLAVPLDPTAPPTGPADPTVELFVARVRALNPGDAEPLVLVAGGPGQAASELYLSLRAVFEPIRRDRDLIIVDQRGTGRSSTGFECPAVEPAALDGLDPDELATQVDACLAALEHDPRWFTSSVAVRDLDAVRQALGLARWNLYGVSYGTRVVQHYLRRHAEAVGAVILDGVVPSQRVLGPALAANAGHALDGLATQCLQEPSCASQFGDIRDSLRDVLARLDEDRVVIELPGPADGRPQTFAFRREDAAGAVRFLSYRAETLGLLPLLIDAAAGGYYAPLAAQALLVTEQLGGALSFPLHNSVICSEDAPFFMEQASISEESRDPALAVAAAAVSLDEHGPGGPDARAADAGPAAAMLPAGARQNEDGSYLGTGLLEVLRGICARWPRGFVDADFRAPLLSDRPVLLLSGELDPVTPPGEAHVAMAGGLTNAVHLIGRGQGHGLAPVGCVPRLMREFLADPVPGALASECVNRMTGPAFFLDFNGPAP